MKSRPPVDPSLFVETRRKNGEYSLGRKICGANALIVYLNPVSNTGGQRCRTLKMPLRSGNRQWKQEDLWKKLREN